MKINLENKYNILIPKIFYNNQILYEGNEKNNNRHFFIMDKENPCPSGPYKIDAVFNIFETYPSKEFAPERGVLYLVTITYDYVEKILDFSIIPNIEFRPDEIIEHIDVLQSHLVSFVLSNVLSTTLSIVLIGLFAQWIFHRYK